MTTTKDPNQLLARFLDQIAKEAEECVRLKIREVGANTGRDVERIIIDGGGNEDGFGEAWCARFTGACVVRAARKLKINPRFKLSGGVTRQFLAARDLGLEWGTADDVREGRVIPARGWIWARVNDARKIPAVLTQGARTPSHTGVIVGTHGHHLLTCEGNTDVSGDRDGDGCYAQVQSIFDPRFLGVFKPGIQ